MDIEEIGEFGLIERLTKDFAPLNSSTLHGVGDDCAVMDYGDRQVLTTTDMLLEGIHFDLTYCPLKHLGYKAAMVNISDICAMNGEPTQMLVSIGVSKRFTVEQIEELYAGIYLACEKAHVDVVGGDTCSSLTGLTISITCIGTVKKGKAVMRSGAKVHDLICVTGDLGAAYMGLQLLEREKKLFYEQNEPDFQPDFAGREYIIERQLKLRQPIYSETAAYGHMGRRNEVVHKVFTSLYHATREMDVELFTWEKLDKVDEIRRAFNL